MTASMAASARRMSDLLWPTGALTTIWPMILPSSATAWSGVQWRRSMAEIPIRRLAFTLNLLSGRAP